MEFLKENLEKGYLVAKVDATDKFPGTAGCMSATC